MKGLQHVRHPHAYTQNIRANNLPANNMGVASYQYETIHLGASLSLSDPTAVLIAMLHKGIARRVGSLRLACFPYHPRPSNQSSRTVLALLSSHDPFNPGAGSILDTQPSPARSPTHTTITTPCPAHTSMTLCDTRSLMTTHKRDGLGAECRSCLGAPRVFGLGAAGAPHCQ